MQKETTLVPDFLFTTLGRTGQRVFRLGLSGRYRPGEAALRAGIEAGMNYLFWFYWHVQMVRVLREVLPAHREKFVVATGVGNFDNWVVRRGLESCLRRLHTDYIECVPYFKGGSLRRKRCRLPVPHAQSVWPESFDSSRMVAT